MWTDWCMYLLIYRSGKHGSGCLRTMKYSWRGRTDGMTERVFVASLKTMIVPVWWTNSHHKLVWVSRGIINLCCSCWHLSKALWEIAQQSSGGASPQRFVNKRGMTWRECELASALAKASMAADHFVYLPNLNGGASKTCGHLWKKPVNLVNEGLHLKQSAVCFQ